MRLISFNEVTVTSTVDGTTRRALRAILQDDGDSFPLLMAEDHPYWAQAQEIVEAFQQGDLSNEDMAQRFYDLVVPVRKVEEKLVKVAGLDGRMHMSSTTITVDHEPIDPVLEAHIMRLLKADGSPRDTQNWTSFVKFVENLYSNTSDFVRTQLFGWLEAQNEHGNGFTITSDGCLIGYKGCQGTKEEPRSINTGPAIVDGVRQHGHILNKVGSVIEMPRSAVQFDPEVGCSSGLHVGTYNYARGFARGILLTVKVNPRDVVSVPTECSAQKLRACRYEVLSLTEVEYTEPTWGEDDDYYLDCGCLREDCECDDDFCECCEDCGYSPCECEDDEDQDDEEEYSQEEHTPRHAAPTDTEGERLRLRYVRSDGEQKEYDVLVKGMKGEHLHAQLLSTGEPRTFLMTNIMEMTPLPQQEDAPEATSASRQEKAQQPQESREPSSGSIFEDLMPGAPRELQDAPRGLFGQKEEKPAEEKKEESAQDIFEGLLTNVPAPAQQALRDIFSSLEEKAQTPPTQEKPAPGLKSFLGQSGFGFIAGPDNTSQADFLEELKKFFGNGGDDHRGGPRHH